MKLFVIGTLFGGLLTGGIAFYLYQTHPKVEVKTVTVKEGGIDGRDSNTLSADLVNRQIEELSALVGEAFDARYVMILHTTTNGIQSVADIAQKRAADPTVRSVANDVRNEAANRLSGLTALRSKYNLIHD
jgi:hypothetical protein